jgi:anhydro-N-acetylmuramic acid kinase
LATSTEHIAQIIANDLGNKKNVLVTGGGAFNSFLLERIKAKTNCEIIIPNNETINFKEALIFAFLGYLRLNEKINTLSSVTGAKSDSVGGAVYLGRP